MKHLTIFLIACSMVQAAHGEPGRSTSHVAYVYPAGAEQGAALQVTAAGRNLRSIKDVYVTGEGVKAKYVLTVPNFKKTYGDYIKQLQKERRQMAAAKRNKGKKKVDEKKQDDDKIIPPDHPIFNDLKKRSDDELQILLRRYYKENKQKNKELDELALLKIEVEPDAKPGMREIRLHTNSGVSNPIRFYIGNKPERMEREPNDRRSNSGALKPPFMFNGQITAGDIDRIKFTAKAGQQLLIQGHARSIIPYIADAVPGWFQATLSLLDTSGNELAFADDYRFSPDPVLFYKIPADGDYTIVIRDSIYRGREDFVYRISVGEDPFVTHVFPLGGSRERSMQANLTGWNLNKKVIALDTGFDAGTVQQLSMLGSNLVPYAVDDLPEVMEKQENDSVQAAQRVASPVIVNGRIESPGDRDVYAIKGRPGDRLIIDINARRLHSPMDSLLKFTDEKGNLIAMNDDTERLNIGMLTHHADSCLNVRLPREGTYFIHVSDAQNQGGDEYGYRLRISRPTPDFSLSATPSSITARLGCSVPITVYAIRKDGFDGEIDILLKDAPKGFKLNGATIPSGKNSVTMTLTAPRDTRNTLFKIRLQGRAKVDRHVVTRNVVPCEAMTQAFITPHVVPVEDMMVFVGGWGEAPEVMLTKNSRVKIKPGGSTNLRIKKTKSEGSLVMKLYKPPEGISLVQKREGKNALSLALHASDKVKAGTAGNLMIEVFKKQKNKKNNKIRLLSMGVTPAFPYIVE